MKMYVIINFVTALVIWIVQWLTEMHKMTTKRAGILLLNWWREKMVVVHYPAVSIMNHLFDSWEEMVRKTE